MCDSDGVDMPVSARVITQELTDWIGSVCPDVSVRACGMGEGIDDDAITVRLLSAAPQSHMLTGSTQSIALDYLVAIEIADVFDAQDLLAEIAFGIGRQSAFELTDASAFQLAAQVAEHPAAAVVIRARLMRESEPRAASVVRLPLVVHATQTRIVEGTILFENDAAVVGATIALSGRPKGTITDRTGRFSLSAPAGPETQCVLDVRFKRQRLQVTVDPDAPILIRLPMEATDARLS